MNLLKRVSRDDIEEEYIGDKFVDLTDEQGMTEEVSSSVRTMIRVAEINRYEDLHKFEGITYSGDILVLNYTSMSKDELGMKRLLRRSHEIVKDVNGDVVMLPNSMLLMTPSGIRISRQKLQ